MPTETTICEGYPSKSPLTHHALTCFYKHQMRGGAITIISFQLVTMPHIIPHKISSANTQTYTDSLM